MHSARCSLLDDLISESEQARRDVKSQGICGFEIDDEIKFPGLNDGKISRLLAPENSSSIHAHLFISGRNICAVAHQTAHLHELAREVYGRNSVGRCEPHNLVARTKQKGVRGDYECGSQRPTLFRPYTS